VTYIDGPIYSDLALFCGNYEGRSFNSMTDGYDSKGTLLLVTSGDELPAEVAFMCDGVDVVIGTISPPHVVTRIRHRRGRAHRTPNLRRQRRAGPHRQGAYGGCHRGAALLRLRLVLRWPSRRAFASSAFGTCTST
jgi:hypothetical protein